MANYELHEFQWDKIYSKEIDPKRVENFKGFSYTTSSLGTVIVDKNTDLEFQRKFVSLHTTKVSQNKFNQVIDIEFDEFIKRDTVDVIGNLQAQIDQLLAEKGLLSGEKAADLNKIKSLTNQINSLNAQITKLKTAPAAIINEYPDTLSAPGKLTSGTKTDRLLSKNRKALAIMETNGNFTIYKGEFDGKGEPLPGTEREILFQKNATVGDQKDWVFIGKVSGAWSSFMEQYAIWTSKEEGPIKESQFFKRNFYVDADGDYEIVIAVDDTGTAKIDNVTIPVDGGSFRNSLTGLRINRGLNFPAITINKLRETKINLKKGWHVLDISVINTGGPGGMAAIIKSPDSPSTTTTVAVRPPAPNNTFGINRPNSPFGSSTFNNAFGINRPNQPATTTITTPGTPGKIIWDTKTHAKAYSVNSTESFPVIGSPFVFWIYTGETENDGQGQLELVKTSPTWNVSWGSGRTKLSKASRVKLDDGGNLSLIDGSKFIWTSYGQ